VSKNKPTKDELAGKLEDIFEHFGMRKKEPEKADPAVGEQSLEEPAVKKPAVKSTTIEELVGALPVDAESLVKKNPADLPAATKTAIAEQSERLRAELEEANDRMLRIQAELENYRKRAARELQDERRYAAVALLRDLLPVWDNINRAIESAEQNHDIAALLEGVKMVAQQFEDVLGQHDCRRIESLHQPFDPNLHEAISQQPSGECPPGTVVLETQTGFQIHDRVVRPSQVIVSMKSKQQNLEDE